MYLRMLDIDNFVEINKLQEVSDPIYLEHGRPTPKGLFSNEIFGVTQYDRQSIWAYIDLGTKLLHPLAVINFKRYGSKYEKIIYGIGKYKMIDGDFVEAEDGETGIDFLYENYDKIKWRKTESITSKAMIEFLSKGKDKLFIDKFPVCPPFYRDINDNPNIGVNIVNKLYKRLLSLASAMKSKGSFSFFSNMTKGEMEKSLVDIFNHYTGMLKGKLGFLRRYVMGRNVDYGVWLVLSAPRITGERYTDMPVDFDHFGYPLHAVLSMAKPFIVQGVRTFFENEFQRSGKYSVIKDGKRINLDFIHPELHFSNDYIDKKIDAFIHGPSTRFEPIKLPPNAQNVNGYMTLKGRFGASENITDRPLTWTDVFFIVATQETRNKHVIQSRYPIEHMYSVAYCKIRVMSTIKTIAAVIDGVEYKWYPLVEPGKDARNAFINTLSPCNVYLKGEGADFDGDSVPNRMLFTDEANIEAEKFMRNKKNFLDFCGNNIRTTTIDFIQLAYSLSLPTNKVPLEDPN